MCFGELASMFPESGGIYEFCKQAFGRFWTFMMGYITLIAANITIAMLVVGAIQYLLPGGMPIIKIMLSLMFIFIFNFVAYRGMKTSAVMLIAFAFITMGTLVSLILPGLFSMKAANFTPFFPFSGSVVFITIFFISETFFGWETATFLAGETKDGQKVMPKALILSTIIISILCLLFVTTSIGSMGWQTFGASSVPFSDLGEHYFGGRGIFTILVYMAILGSVAGWIVSAPRLILAMAKDKFFLTQFAEVHPKYKTPGRAIILQTIITSLIVLIGTGSYTKLVQLLIPLVLIIYSAVLLSLVILRFKQPNRERYFKAPFGKIGPLIIIVFNIILVVAWAMEGNHTASIIGLGLSFISIGIPLYILIESYNDPKMVRYLNDVIAYPNYFLEGFLIPSYVKKDIFSLIGDVKGKQVLEFGCNVGTVTHHLAERIGPNGKIYATNLSRGELDIAKNRINKKRQKMARILADIELIHDIEHSSRVHPSVPPIDAIVSVGNLSYLSDMKKILLEMNSLLPENGRICFMEFVDYFHLLPNPNWLKSNSEIKQLFLDAGFSVYVKKVPGFLWNYLYIYGMKTKEHIPMI